MADEQVLSLSDSRPTGYMGAEMCDIQGGEVVDVWGAGPVGQLAMDSAHVLGVAMVIAIDDLPTASRWPPPRATARSTIPTSAPPCWS